MHNTLSYLDAVKLSYELWIGLSLGYNKSGYIQNHQSEEIQKYGSPVKDCWMCKWSDENSRSDESIRIRCSRCPLSSCGKDSLFSAWYRASNGGALPYLKQAMEAAEAIRDVFKKELNRLEGEVKS